MDIIFSLKGLHCLLSEHGSWRLFSLCILLLREAHLVESEIQCFPSRHKTANRFLEVPVKSAVICKKILHSIDIFCERILDFPGVYRDFWLSARWILNCANTNIALRFSTCFFCLQKKKNHMQRLESFEVYGAPLSITSSHICMNVAPSYPETQ